MIRCVCVLPGCVDIGGWKISSLCTGPVRETVRKSRKREEDKPHINIPEINREEEMISWDYEINNETVTR